MENRAVTKRSSAEFVLSIITATYNRGYCLHNLYLSLQRQTCFQFEWIIVDDGSVDNTKQLVQTWRKEEHSFPICYIQKPNGGKHTAMNVGVSEAKGDFVFFVDSDDTLTQDAVEKAVLWCRQIADDACFAGVSGCKADRAGNLLGKFPPDTDHVDATNIERYRRHLEGDKAEIYRTALLREYPFPEFPGERFLPEGAVWDEIAHHGYKLRWFHDIIYLCEYQTDGLTQNNLEHIRHSFQGFTLVKKKMYTYYPFPQNWKALIAYVETAHRCGLRGTAIKENMEIGTAAYCTARILCIVKQFLLKWKEKHIGK